MLDSAKAEQSPIPVRVVGLHRACIRVVGLHRACN
jgi:hypothetical protein